MGLKFGLVEDMNAVLRVRRRKAGTPVHHKYLQREGDVRRPHGKLRIGECGMRI